MSSNHHANAADAITALGYNGANLDVARHWLTCWRGNTPPRMTGFHTGAIWQLKPAMMFYRVVKDESLTCIHAGALLRVALGFDASNRDLLALVPKEQRDERLDWAWRITEGAVSVLYRQFTSQDGHSGLAQGIALPFFGEDDKGARRFLMHTNWRPVGTDWIMGNVDVELKQVSDRRMISYTAEVEKLAQVVNL
jgi:hypothetical protein